MRRWLSLVAKIVVSVGLLYLVVRSVDLAAAGERLAAVDAGWAVLGLAFLGGIIALSSIRWRAVATALGAGLSLARHLRLNVISVFFNQALPSTLGGDAVRTWMARGTPAGLAGAAYAVLADRAAGFVALLLIVAAGLPWSLGLVADGRGQAALLLLLALGVGATLTYLAVGLMPAAWAGRWRLFGFLRGASHAGWKSLLRLDPGAGALVLSIAGHGCTILGIWALGRALKVDPGLLPIAALVPAVLLVSMIPVTVAGWGVREGAMIGALGFAGVPSPDALALSILYGLAMIAWGLVGGILWLAGGRGRLATPRLAEVAAGSETPR